MKDSTVIATTKKGHRVFLENVGRIGQPYTVVFTEDTIGVVFHPAGKRRVVASKGGVIDIESKKVTQWKQSATMATVTAEANTIVIRRSV